MSARTSSVRPLTCAIALVLLTSAKPASNQAHQVCRNLTGTHNGYFFTFWKDGGEACMTLGAKGQYRTHYRLEHRKNLVAGMGWRTGAANRKVGYRAGSFDAGSNSYLTLYGWSIDPLVEYYVVDSWGTQFKPPGLGSQVLGIVASDGGTYQIYRTQRLNQPSIQGQQTFYQYWSVRTDRRPIGVSASITFSNHVSAWGKLGMKLGRMDYQVLATEGFGSAGGSAVTIWEE